MKEIRSFWCDARPTMEDIVQAFEIAATGTPVSINWYVRYSGNYNRVITLQTTEKFTPEEYWENCIPHKYCL